MKRTNTIAASLLVLGAIASTTWHQSAADAAPVAKAPTPKLIPARGAPQSLSPAVNDESARYGASIEQFNPIPNQPASGPARMFGMAGGDPAMNGLYTFLAFNGEDGPVAFLIGNINRYSILAASPGRIDLEIRENGQRADGTITNVTRRVIVTWIIPAGAFAPARITITPAT
jgi:hypothetical protein